MGKKSLIPAPSRSSFQADVAAVVQGLLDNTNVKRLDVSVDKTRRTARFRAVGEDGRASTTDILAPGLVTTVTSMPSTRKAFEKKVVSLFEQGYSQTDSGRILNCSQAHISNTQRRLGLR